ncbi:hypothetical protein CIL05_13355 [Virgibacillus profundi]|uniref:Uncharacterized protein n=1 Tax=Virgibacillus profundi TaxID=2024555 RepID=A0A2A2ID17_9BACI|nr:DUF2116 family Zn-ribbon domain-containing protein [Virgibacillus profundi]PAV28963.1 hypothetical protein CIL05_13355 [Virgibacillus profundi]PXY53131.1 DUF2116 family Zn-ribbon domain-containing protein [Virgibacillus profundi]
MTCRNCGHEINDKNQFCPECGSKLSEQKKGRNRRKHLLLFVFIMIPIVALSIFYFVGKEKFTPDNIIQDLEESVTNEDVNSLQDLISTSDEAFKITKDNTAILMKFFINNPEKFKNIINKLNEQAELLKNNHTESNSVAMFGTINLTEDGKQWLLFDKYTLDIIPANIMLATDNKEIDLYINDEKVATSSNETFEESFGPFMPGTHRLKAAFENQYTSTEMEDEVSLFDMAEDTKRHSLKLPVTDVSLTSLYNEYKLFINDEETDITINEGEQSIGIFPADSSTSVHIQKEFPWGVVKSEEATISSGAIQFDSIQVLSKDEQLELMQQLNGTVSSYHEALTKKDVSLYQDGVTDNMKKILADHLEDTSDWGPPYEGKLVRAEYDNSKITYPEYNEELKGYTITLRAHYFLYEPEGHAYGNLSWLGRDLDKKQYQASKGLTVLYDESESSWKLHHIENEFFHLSERNEQIFEMND